MQSEQLAMQFEQYGGRRGVNVERGKHSGAGEGRQSGLPVDIVS